MSELDEIKWRDIPGFPRHQVSADGRLRSRLRGQMKLRPCGRSGYLGVCVRVDERRRNLFAHRAVALAWLSPVNQEGAEVAHINGDKFDNRAANLAWVTKIENEAHKRHHGTALLGARNPRAKLSTEAVRSIRTLSAEGIPYSRIAASYAIAKSHVGRIVRGENRTDG